MKKIILTILVAMIGLAAFAQLSSSKYVTWKYSAKKIGDVYEIRMTAAIAKGWRVFAQGASAGPIPTVIIFFNNPAITLTGPTTETGRLIKSSNKWNPIKYYENSVAFVQRVRLKGDTATTVSGSIKFVVSDGYQWAKVSTANFSIEIGK